MKKNICFILLSLAMLMVMPFTVRAIVAPHTSLNQVGCSSCHNATVTASTSFNNMCVTCHKPGSANVNVTSVFYQSDAANIYNRFNGFSSGIAPAKLKFTSHNWAGSEVAPEAGASRPTNNLMNMASLGTSLSCARCHNVHLAKSSGSNSAPFLRSLNNNDEMCRDCHRTRDTSSHLLGSHPVNFRYTSATSKAVTNPADYFVPPRSANPGNPSAAMKMVNGKIQCTSCHAVHYADSNSGTVDSRSSWANLSSSRGMLLRTDTFGKTAEATSVNICTNCHNKPNHQVYPGSKTATKMIQCVDCHSGHVEYLKPADVALGGDNAKPNIYMLRRYVNYSAGVKLDSYRRKAFMTSTSSTAPLLNASGTGICQACHNPPANVPDHLTKTNKDQCIVCHGGSLHSDRAPIGCNDCHGTPPQHTVAGTVNYGTEQNKIMSKGYAVYSSRLGVPQKSYSLVTPSIYKNESTAGHPTHAAAKPYSFSCDQCHLGNNHLTQTYQEVFKTKTGILAGTSAVFVAGDASSTCSNMYCHSYGTATLKGAKSINWASGVRGSIINAGDGRCVSCHNGVNTTYSNLSTNSHFRHVDRNGKFINCNVCHNATVSANDTISNYANHVNGVRNVSFSGTPASGTTWNGTTCTTSACHSNGRGAPALVTPTWSDRNSGKCGTCHLTAVDTGFGIMSSGTHFAHISSSYGPKRNTNNLCGACHVFTGELAGTHVDGSISKNEGGNGATYCKNCHAQSTPNWTTPVRQTCQSCHSGMGSGSTESAANRSWSNYDATGVQAPFKHYSTFRKVGHGAYVSIVCSDCHNANSKHIDGSLTATGSYRGARIFSNMSGLNATYSADKLCIDCHNDVANGGRNIVTDPNKMNFLSHVSERSVPTISQCVTCHDVHGTANKAMINTTFKVYTGNGRGAAVKTVNFSNMTTGFVNASRTGICQVCHTNTRYYRNYTSTTGVYVSSDSGNYKGSWGHMGNSKRCLNCHKHNAGGFAFKVGGNGTCNGCHGYPPKTNAHVFHIMSASLKPVADEFMGTSNNTMSCGTCHFNGVQATFDAGHTSPPNASIDVQDSLKFNNAGSLNNSNYNPTFSCSNVSCHFKASPTWK